MTGRRKNSALIIRLVFSFRCPDCKIRGLRFPGKNRIGRGIFQKRYQFLKFKCAHRLKHFCTVGRRLCVKPAANFSQSDAALFLHCLNCGLHCKTGIPGNGSRFCLRRLCEDDKNSLRSPGSKLCMRQRKGKVHINRFFCCSYVELHSAGGWKLVSGGCNMG